MEKKLAWLRTLVHGLSSPLQVNLVPEDRLVRRILLRSHGQDVPLLDQLVEDLLRARPGLLERLDGNSAGLVLVGLDGLQELRRSTDVVVRLGK